MFKPITAFTGVSVNDVGAAKKFYSDILGLDVQEDGPGIRISLPGGNSLLAYAKDNHQPATYTCLDFVVEDIDSAVAELSQRGVQFERYENMPQDDKGILRGQSLNMGPDIAWFKDPAGNILAILQDA